MVPRGHGVHRPRRRERGPQPALRAVGHDAVPHRRLGRAVRARPARPRGPARAAPGDPRQDALPHGDRALQRQAPAAVVLGRGRGSPRGAPHREALLLPQAAGGPHAGDRVPPHDRPARRGRRRLSGMRIATKFPFGLVQKSRDLASATEVIVYPALVPVSPAVLRGLPVRHGGNGQTLAAAATGTSSGCATSGPATIHATSTGGRRRGGACPSCARTRTTTAAGSSRPARQRRGRGRGRRRARSRRRSPRRRLTRSSCSAAGSASRSCCAARPLAADTGPAQATRIPCARSRSSSPRRPAAALETRRAPERRDGARAAGRRARAGARRARRPCPTRGGRREGSRRRTGS